MKRIRLNIPRCYLSVGLLGSLLIGCQPTPDSSVVVDKSEGVLDEYIIPSVEEGEIKNMDVPESWSGYLEIGEG